MTTTSRQNRRPVFGMARDGLRFVLPLAALAAAGLALGWPWLAWPVLALVAFVAFFFRDPERVPPPASEAILAPADGRVVEVIPFSEWRGAGVEPLTQVGIFLSPWDVHINRAPAAGTVEAVEGRPGRFQVAWAPAASFQNEQTLIRLRTGDGHLWVKQVAGILARRIVTWVRPGDKVEAGDRIGLIRFGSRTDLIFPSRYAVRVRPGQRAVAGVTVVAVRE
jgi:phosphatidylserine decarboxylase